MGLTVLKSVAQVSGVIRFGVRPTTLEHMPIHLT